MHNTPKPVLLRGGDCEDENLCNLIINYLPLSINEQALYDMFSPFGPIAHHKLIVDKATGASLGFGFVKFVYAENASKAIAEMSGKKMGDKVIRVNVSKRKEETASTLYVAGFSTSWGKDEFEQLFHPYGMNSEIFLPPSKSRVSELISSIVIDGSRECKIFISYFFMFSCFIFYFRRCFRIENFV